MCFVFVDVFDSVEDTIDVLSVAQVAALAVVRSVKLK
jgi:hypothetical protein